MVEDADGSLLVVDTGAWYKLCCPTSQLAKPDVLGAIYRVRRKGSGNRRPPRTQARVGLDATPDLMRLLDDSRPAVLSRVLHQLAKVGETAMRALAGRRGSVGMAEARRNAVWALTRIDGARARETVRIALGDRDETVRRPRSTPTASGVTVAPSRNS